LNLSVSLVLFAVSAATSALIVVPMRRLALARGLVAHPRADRFHDSVVPLLGGPACVLGLVLVLSLVWAGITRVGAPVHSDARLFAAVLAGIVGLCAVGLRDDVRALTPLPKAVLEGMILAAAILIWRPEGRLAGPLARIAAWVAMMVMVNAWNYLDHADGVFSGAILAGSAMLAVGSRTAGAGGAALVIPCGLAGVGLGFLFWNRPPARIFLGDAGSLSLGFASVFAGLVLFDRAAPDHLARTVGAQALPLADFLLVTCVRLRAGRNPFVGGREHTGHRLTRRLGPRGAVLTVAALAALLVLAGILLAKVPSGAGIGVVLLAAALLAFALGRLPSPDAA
jgi:UDP-GlcNAc:undecaprenyl-phosphate/decaprenyl-phosphate GlcNAc-1-phosphate transferase